MAIWRMHLWLLAFACAALVLFRLAWPWASDVESGTWPVLLAASSVFTPKRRWRVRDTYPFLSVVSTLIFAFSAYHSLQSADEHRLDERVTSRLELVSRAAADEIEDRTRVLRRMARRVAAGSYPRQDVWASDAASIVSEETGLEYVVWVDERLNERVSLSSQALVDLIPDKQFGAVFAASVTQARTSGVPCLSGVFELPNAGRGFLIAVPVGGTREDSDCIVGVIRVDVLLGVALTSKALSDVTIHIAEGGRPVFESTIPDAAPPPKSQIGQIEIRGMVWTIEVAPGPTLVSSTETHMPIMALVFGTIVAILLGTAIQLALSTKSRAEALEDANRKLSNEFRERSQIQDKLRRSTALLRAVFESANYSVISTDPDGVILLFNRAAEEMLGYTVDEVVGNVTPEVLHDRSEVVERAQVLSAELGVAVEPGFETFVAKARLGVPDENEWTYIRKDGSRLPVSLSVTALRDEATGEIIGFVGIAADITERKQAEAALLEAKNAAEAATKAKSDFLANMSHEIRTPMNGVLGMTALLLDTPLTQQQLDYIETIRVSGDALLTVINDILDFSKIESGMLDLEMHAFDLRDCIEGALDLLAPKAAEKHLDLLYWIDEGVPSTIVTDENRLRQILVNLLGNAVKFTSEGEVLVSVRAFRAEKDQDFVFEFAVRDTGIGIPESAIGRLFQSFSQVDASTTRKFGGTGLGLAICQRLVELLGGTIRVESEFGKGSVFTFSIVASAVRSMPRVYLRGTQPDLHGRRVLIVDDNHTNCQILSTQTASWGMHPVAVASGVEALDLLGTGEQFDLCVLDGQMPEMDGVELAGLIRNEASGRNLPIVLLSSIGWKESDRTREINFAAKLTKPAKPSQLWDVFVEILSQKHFGESARVAQPAGEMVALQTNSRIHVLVAEDNPVNQKVAIGLLARLGYSADVAGTGHEAIRALEHKRYDIVFMDVQMPEMDGFEATSRIRANWPQSATRPVIIAMTANAMEGDREECLAAGMDDYISKPIRADQLEEVLSKWMRGRVETRP